MALGAGALVASPAVADAQPSLCTVTVQTSTGSVTRYAGTGSYRAKVTCQDSPIAIYVRFGTWQAVGNNVPSVASCDPPDRVTRVEPQLRDA